MAETTSMTSFTLRPGEDFRLICECQVHARRERALWRRSLRVARRAATHIKRRGAALLLVPLAFGALELPTEAMTEFALFAKPQSIEMRMTGSNALPLVTDELRDRYLEPFSARRFTLEIAKEEFFRSRIPYGAIIYREARRHNLSPELVAAIVRTESDFRPTLVSHKNAQGLMQIVPSTGRLMGESDLFDPERNIAAGTKYLRYLFDRFGDQRIVLAAYNAGEGNVDKFGGIPPFPETENYVRKVNAHTSSYRERIRGTYVSSLRIRNSVIAR